MKGDFLPISINDHYLFCLVLICDVFLKLQFMACKALSTVLCSILFFIIYGLHSDNVFCYFLCKPRNSLTMAPKEFLASLLAFLPVSTFCQNMWDRWDLLQSIWEIIFFRVLTLGCHSYSCIFLQWLDFTCFPYQLQNSPFITFIFVIKSKIDTKYYLSV